MTQRLLPHQTDRRFLAHAGTGTDLIFNRGIDLPGFASFPLVDDPKARPILVEQMRALIDVAREAGLGAVIDTPTWMANPDRAAKLGYTPDQLTRINQQAVGMMRDLRNGVGGDDVVLALCLGPARDPYGAEDPLSVAAARRYHRHQIETARDAGIDLVNAYTFNQVQEAAGVALAAQDTGVPVAVSLVVETDGCLHNGTPLQDALSQIDDLTDGAAAYFMVNCAHPTHFDTALTDNPRLKGIVVNASRCSHAELDEATTLDDGDPAELATQIAALVARFPDLTVVGGCCGTDMRHMRAMAQRITA